MIGKGLPPLAHVVWRLGGDGTSEDVVVYDAIVFVFDEVWSGLDLELSRSRNLGVQVVGQTGHPS